jgi:general secretion pathway protein B
LPRWAVAAIVALGVAVLVLAGAWWQSTRTATSTPTTAAEPVPQRTVTLPPPVAGNQTTAATPQPAADRSDARALANSATSDVGSSLAAAAQADPAPSAEAPSLAAPSRQPTDDAALPTAAALMAQGVALPQLRLELHAFSERPGERYVFINGRKYVEGERLPEGTQLVSITPLGAVLSQYGQRFLLLPD